MGVVVKEKVPGSGKWWTIIHYRGRRVTKCIGTKAEAERVAEALRTRLANDTTIELFADSPSLNGTPAVPTFGEFVRDYLDNYARVALKHSTWRSYDVIVNKHLLPAWTERRLDQINRADVKTLLLSLQQSLAPATVHNIRVLISGIFTHAVEDELLTSNPALRMGKHVRKDDAVKSVRPLTKDQVRAFLGAAREHEPQHYAFFLTMFRTGMRLGELLGLAWEDIDLVGKVIQVRRSYSHGRFSTPKSHKCRMVDMSDQLCAVMQQHQSDLLQRHGGKLRAVTMQGVGPIRLVFPNSRGFPMDGDGFRSRVFYPLIELADVPRFRLHDARHTFASQLLANGEPLNYVKEQLGHASITTTVDTYGHLVPGSNRRAVNRLDDEAPGLRLVVG